MTRRALLVALAFGLALTALFWVDPVFIPLVLLGPPVTGVTAALRGMSLGWISLVWLVAGLGAVVSDFVINHEDVVFHLVLTAFVIGLAAASWAVTRRVRPVAPSTV